MNRTLSTVVLTLVVALVMVAAAALAYVYSGRYNVAATAPHNSLSRWLLQTTQKHSVKAHAKKVGSPPQLSAEKLSHGFEHYASTCVTCHGAPGVERGELGKGITPTPPDLSKTVARWSEQELYWIVKHGIKFAGMPAFGPTHSDDELWALVAFLKRLPNTSAEQYRRMSAELKEKSKAASVGSSDGHHR